MKVLVNVAREHLKVGEWIECQAVKLEEASDGSFELVITTDVERMRETERQFGRART